LECSISPVVRVEWFFSLSADRIINAASAAPSQFTPRSAAARSISSPNRLKQDEIVRKPHANGPTKIVHSLSIDCSFRPLFVALFAALAGVSMVHAQDARELTSVSQIRALTPQQASRHLPIRVRGIVTVLSGWKSSFFFRDATTGISVDRTRDDPPVAAGQEVEIRGVTGAGLFAPVILASDVRLLGEGKLPSAPAFDYGELVSGRQDSQWIRVHGIVRTAVIKSAWGRPVLFLNIDIGMGNLITARVHDFLSTGIENLVASVVSVRGVCGTAFNEKRQTVGLRLFVQNLTDVQVEQPAPADPFDLPTSGLDGLLQFSSQDRGGAVLRVKVRGTLIYQDVARGLYIQSGASAVFVRSEQRTSVPLGSELEVIGYPAAGSYSPTLVDALFRPTGQRPPIAAKSILGSDALTENDGFLSAPYDSMLVEVRGWLLEQFAGGEEDVFLLQNDGGIITVRLRNPPGATRLSLLRGALVRATGVFIAKVDEYHEVRSFEILARTPSDLVMLVKPSWWTSAHLIWALATLALLALATSAWLTLRHREQRTTQIEQSNAKLKNEIYARQLAQEALQRKSEELFLSNKRLEQFSSEEIRRSDAIRITALESARLGDWQIDLASGVVKRSLLHDRIFGYPEKLPEWDFAVFIKHVFAEDRRRVQQIYEENLQQGKGWDFECRITWPDQSIHWIWACGGPYRDQSGKITFVMGTVADITARKQAEGLRAHSQKLESLGTLAGGIAHDFNNILLAITGNVKLAIADCPEDHPAQIYLSEIAKAGARATNLIRSILTFSRPGELKRHSTDLQSVIEEALKLVRATVPAAIEFRQSFRSALPPVLADPTQIHQIVVNLATNAAHAIGARSAGVINVSLEFADLTANSPATSPALPIGSYVVLSFTDNGCGIDVQILERIFDPFFTTKDIGEGTGLGLAVVHGIVKSHDGGICVQSSLGVGTTFKLFFPPSSSAVSTEPQGESLRWRNRTERVLYVDDEESLVLLVTRTLERIGYKVTGQTNPLGALELFRSNPDAYDVVVTDLAMPGLSGFELTSGLQRIRADIPVVITSGYIRPEDQQRAMAMGLRGLILKPNAIEQLCLTLDAIFRH
jgi:PAS domain S-box-containing protein